MTLREQMPNDSAAVFLNTDEFAESVSYTPLGGAASDINALFSGRTEEARDVDSGQKNFRTGYLRVSKGDVTSPTYGDTVSINSEDWFVWGIIEQDDHMALLDIERTETIERTGPQYRIKE